MLFIRKSAPFPAPQFGEYFENNAPGSSTVTFSSISFGKGRNVVGIYTSNTITGVTFNGTSGAQQASLTHDGQEHDFWDVDLTSAATGDLVITHSGGTPQRTCGGLWWLGDAAFVSASSVTDTGNDGTINLDDTLTAGDHYLGFGHLRLNTYAGAMTLTGWTESWAPNENDTARWTFGGHDFDVAGGATTYTFDTSEATPGSSGGIAASWRPN